MKKCKNCQIEKSINNFSTQRSRGKEYINNVCSDCCKEKQNKYRKENKEKIKQANIKYYDSIKLDPQYIESSKEYRNINKDKKQEYDKSYREEHKEKYKQYCIDNKENIAEVRNAYYINNMQDRKEYNKKWVNNNKELKYEINYRYIVDRLKKDISFKLRKGVSLSINKYLKLNNSSKNNSSILNFLPYSIEELKVHIEKLFEPWMTWNNHGKYDPKSWDDNDSSTWTWNIDHIIPQSELSYVSMEDENFKKCWELSNLRPLSAKINVLEGVSRVRHKNK